MELLERNHLASRRSDRPRKARNAYAASLAKRENPIIESLSPELWKLCYPRVFEEVGRFYSPKIPAAATFAALNIAMSTNRESMPVQSRMEVMTASKLVNFGMPVFFIAPALLAAIQQTVPPHELEWPEMKLPFEAAILMLPKGSFAHRKDGPCPYIAYSRWRAGETHPLVPGSKQTTTSELDTFVVVASCYEAEGSPTYVEGFTSNIMPKITLRDIPTVVAGFRTFAPAYEAPALDQLYISEPDDKAFVAGATSLLFGTLLVLLERPELREPGRHTGKRTKEGTEIWTPNVIGGRYQILREVGSHEGISPRMHWRRGHWRQQPYGERRTMRRLTWIEPVLVNAEQHEPKPSATGAPAPRIAGTM